MPLIRVTEKEHKRAKELQRELQEMGVSKSLKLCYADVVQKSHLWSRIGVEGFKPSKKKSGGGDSWPGFGLGLR